MLPAYDDETLFKNYVKMREANECYNNHLEQPGMVKLIGDVRGLRVLDIGCGWGDGAKRFAEAGAAHVCAIDPSRKMIEAAKAKNSHPLIQYEKIGVEVMDVIAQEFDIAVSSLMLHYLKDLKTVFEKVNRRLVKGGKFVFSMEHPIRTANLVAQRWQVADNGIDTPFSPLDAFVMDSYGKEGYRKVAWLGTNVSKYHHRFETIFNALADTNFILEKIIEPKPTTELIKQFPGQMSKALVRPHYLLGRCRKA